MKPRARLIAAGLLACSVAQAAPPAPVWTPLAGPAGTTPGAPWVFAGLPKQTLPRTQYSLERLDGQAVLRVEAEASYGNLVHPFQPPSPEAGSLSWRWRIDKPLVGADLRQKAGDDVALKVCALFQLPKDALPFVERQLFRLAERSAGEALPTATLCYVWEPSWPEGSVVPNAFSRRVRYLTLSGAPGLWSAVSRDLGADFLRAFGDEAREVPPLLAIGVGADADNTGGRSLGYLADLRWVRGPAR